MVRERGPCVTHWVSTGIGQPSKVPLVYDNQPEGPGAGGRLLDERAAAGDRGYLVETGADVTGDGVRDLVVRDWYPGAALVCERVGITVFEGGRAPVSAWLTQHALSAECHGPSATLAALGDWNGDGIDDVVAEDIAFVRGEAGDFEEDAERCWNGAALGDVDADGFRDSGCVSADDGPMIAWGGPGRARERLSLAAIGGSDEPITRLVPAGDLNGDGHADFIAQGFREHHAIVLGAERESLRVAATFDAPEAGRMRVSALGDVDGDGFADLAIITGGRAALLRGQHRWTATDTQPWLPSFDVAERVVATGDANCDGNNDVLIRREAGLALHLGSASGPRVTALWTSDSTGNLVPLYASAAPAR